MVFLSDVYGETRWAEPWAIDYRNNHGGEKENCPILNEMVDAMATIDSLVKPMKEVVINLPVLESLTRTAYSAVVSFRNVRSEEDWKKPRTGGNNWKSKVNWDDYERLNPRARGSNLLKYQNINNEVETGRTQDAALEAARQKVAGQGRDRLN